MQSRFRGLFVFGAIFIALSMCLRIVLLVGSARNVDWGVLATGKIFLMGLLFDFCTCLYLLAPAMLFLVLARQKWLTRRPLRVAWGVLMWLVFFGILFDIASEWFFWQEFEHRFNFIAVDYLVYTHEVVANIWQSYPVPAVLAGIGLLSAGLTYLTVRLTRRKDAADTPIRGRLVFGGVYAGLVILCLLAVSQSLAERGSNRYNDELGKNGFYSFVVAFIDNKIDYGSWYMMEDQAKVFARLREMVKTDDAAFTDPAGMDITRAITSDSPERKLNVVVVTVESLSGCFLGVMGNNDHLTPNLDALADEGLFFTRLYATGTRTDRGLEALSLSIPPTPGRSMVKRPDNENMFTIGQVLTAKGYRTKFIYGGNGFFDNMNYFFGHNGFETVDQKNFSGGEITFSNAWGVCDEDLLNKVLQQADSCSQAKEPFYFQVMTTSNHRPFTYPAGKIDIPVGVRNGAVKYTDYAIGDFLRKAKTRPWFEDTIFVIVADHCASSAGKEALTVDKYHIPMFIYSPKYIKPARVDSLCSQMDFAPTLLGLLNMSYTSRFFGKDVLRNDPARALIANYQRLGLYVEGRLAVLEPHEHCRFYKVDPAGLQTEIEPDKSLLTDNISYYQSASALLNRKALTNTLAAK